MHGRRSETVEHQIHLACNQVLQRRPCATIWNMGDKGPSLQLEEFTRQMMRGAIAGRSVIQLAGVLAQILEQAFQVGLGYALRINDDHLRHTGNQANRHKVSLDVVVEPWVHRRSNRMVHGSHEKVVAVGIGTT